jgi:hypothetical protein
MKSKNLFIGILVLFTGVIALLATLHVFEFHWSIFWRLWPMALIICGIAILPLNEYVKSAILLAALGAGCLLYHAENRHYQGNAITRFFNRHTSVWDWDDDDQDLDDDEDDDQDWESAGTQHFSEPFNEVSRASIDIDFGAGDLSLGAPCAELVKADIESNFVKYSFRSERGDDMTSIYLSGKGHIKKNKKSNENDLRLSLCTQPVWDFNLDMGAADAELDFSPYRMGSIEINGGACDLDLRLGDHDCDTKLVINTGASDIDIKVPASLDCQIYVKSAITEKDFQGFEKKERGLWQTPGFGQGQHQILIELSCAVSELSVIRY